MIFAADGEVSFVVLKYVLTSLLVNGVLHSEIYFLQHICVISAHTISLEYSTHLTLGSPFRLRRLTNYP